LYWLYNAAETDSTYTVSAERRERLVRERGYADMGPIGYVDAVEQPNSRPLKCFVIGVPKTDTSCTTSELEQNIARALGYAETGVEGYVPSERVAGTIVLYRVSRAYGEGNKGSRAPVRRRPRRARAAAQAGVDVRRVEGIRVPCSLTDATVRFPCCRSDLSPRASPPHADRARRWQPPGLRLALPALAAFAVYLPAISGGFLSDDYSLLHFLLRRRRAGSGSARGQDLRLRRRPAVEPVPAR
jgi:hypothetical protein